MNELDNLIFVNIITELIQRLHKFQARLMFCIMEVNTEHT